MTVGDLPDDFDPVVHARRLTTVTGQPCVRVEMLFPHAGGKSAYAVILIDDQGLGIAIAKGVGQIESLARREGWIE